MHSVHLQVTFTENYEKWIKHNWSQFTLKIHHIHTQHVNTDTWEKMCLEALLGYSIVRFEFNSHIVELGRDHFRHLSSTESAMQFRLRGKTAPNLHIIVFANLEKNMVIGVTRFESTRWFTFIFEKCVMLFPLYSHDSQTGIKR